jgi:hypothetical protein
MASLQWSAGQRIVWTKAGACYRRTDGQLGKAVGAWRATASGI